MIQITTHKDLKNLLRNKEVYYQDTHVMSIGTLINCILEDKSPNKSLILEEYTWSNKLDKPTSYYLEDITDRLNNSISDIELDLNMTFNPTEKTKEYINRLTEHFYKNVSVKKVVQQYDISEVINELKNKL